MSPSNRICSRVELGATSLPMPSLPLKRRSCGNRRPTARKLWRNSALILIPRFLSLFIPCKYIEQTRAHHTETTCDLNRGNDSRCHNRQKKEQHCDRF